MAPVAIGTTSDARPEPFSLARRLDGFALRVAAEERRRAVVPEPPRVAAEERRRAVGLEPPRVAAAERRPVAAAERREPLDPPVPDFVDRDAERSLACARPVRDRALLPRAVVGSLSPDIVFSP